MRRGAWALLSAALMVALGACATAPQIEPVAKPKPRPEVPAAQPPAPQIKPTSIESARLRTRLNEIQASQMTFGLLRRDGGGPDTPFTSEMLARNFIQIAFFNEYNTGFGPGGETPLRRWEMPVHFGLEFGASVPPSQRARDRMDVARFAARLTKASGHAVAVKSAPNFIVVFASEDDRKDVLAQSAARLPGVSARDLARLERLPEDVYCAVLAFPSPQNPNVYGAAIAVVRAENPDLLRLSCIHEELAQGMGLANDSPAARPSIFNDDDEFALLTRHDELLLAMLYDARLSPGQTRESAANIVRMIARELTGENADGTS